MYTNQKNEPVRPWHSYRNSYVCSGCQAKITMKMTACPKCHRQIDWKARLKK